MTGAAVHWRRCTDLRFEHLGKAIEQFGRIKDGAQHNQAFAGIAMPGDAEQGLAQIGITGKLFCTIDQP
jgi:hypothetical protein